MSWIEISLDATPEAVDWINTLLSTTDYRGEIHIADIHTENTDAENTDAENYSESDCQRCTDRSLDSSPWQFTIRLYVPNDRAVRAQIEKIESLFSPLHRTGMTTLPQMTVLAEKPESIAVPGSAHYRIGQRFVVLTSATADRLRAGEIPLQLATPRAFGSGFHPTTIVSLKLLERHVLPGIQALDFGSGSGILSVALARLGATVLSLDNDSIAVAATQDTVHRNGVASQVTVTRGSLGVGSDLGHWMGGELADPVPTIAANASFDLIVANILARLHLTLVENFRQSLRPGGLLIAAGFTRDYEAEIAAAMTATGLAAIDSERSGEWVALAYRLTAESR